MNKEEKIITLGNELYEEFIEGKQTIDTHELLNLFAKRINNLQSKIDKAIELIKIEKEKMGYAKYDSCLLLIENILKEDK